MVVRRVEPASLTDPAVLAAPDEQEAPVREDGAPATHEPAALATNAGRVEALRATSGLDRSVRFLRGLGVIGAILFFWSAAFCLAWVLVPYLLLSEREPLARRRKIQLAVAASWRWFLRQLEWMTLYRARYEGASVPEGPVVLVANHPSLLDVTAIIGRNPHVCCVVKSGLVNSPLVGRLLRACGHVSAGDGSLMSGAAVLDAVRARLEEGFPVLVFPEGTRSPLFGMHRFRRGAFEIAKRADVPVVPLFLRCDPPALGKGTPVWQHPRKCPTLTVHVGVPIDTNGGDPTSLCKNVESHFRARLSQTGEPSP